ncbi:MULTISPECIES: C40 family peptidase [Pseudomonadaceae]|uniref:C40 family peptidase n=1 Tax=Pseudomonadaceae TaxID=135621 RepID=UPI0003FEFEEB|nr:MULTISPECIES: C40 family peptidase [Pseudomonas]NMZ46515.1 C40 family peptidase [Pseudomonas oryzihabitans]NMZ66043.1 C40 family peptidase [Pseudomonas oryzihabitans]RAU37662.1 peptidoglycan endopeptidase [Pseudomonas sp. RIT 411]
MQAKENSAARTAAPVHKVAARHVTAASAPKTARHAAAAPAPKAAARHVASVDRAQAASAARAKRAARATSALHRKQATAQAATRNVGAQVATRAMDLVGTPYRFGGTNPQNGLDCSGLVNYVYRDVHNVKLPRTSRELAQLKGPKVARGDLKAGDLVFFKTGQRSGIDHVAIYLGNDRFVHAPRSGESVRVDHLSKPYWTKRFASAKRVLQQPTTLAAEADPVADKPRTKRTRKS